MGDHDTGNYNMKGVEPIICTKIRRNRIKIILNMSHLHP